MCGLVRSSLWGSNVIMIVGNMLQFVTTCGSIWHKEIGFYYYCYYFLKLCLFETESAQRFLFRLGLVHKM